MKKKLEKLLSDIDTLKLKSENHNEELSKVLGKMLTTLDCDRAWCLYPCDPESEEWGVPIEITKHEYPGGFEVDHKFPMGEEEKAVFNTYINAKGPVTYGKDADYPMPAEHEKYFMIKSQIATVVYPKHGKQWLLGIHFCEKDRSFSEDDREYFDSLGKKIGIAFDNLNFNKS